MRERERERERERGVLINTYYKHTFLSLNTVKVDNKNNPPPMTQIIDVAYNEYRILTE